MTRQRSLSPLVLVVLLAVAAALIAWFALLEDPAADALARGPVREVAAPAHSQSGASLETEPDDASTESETDGAAVDSAATRANVAERTERELGDAHWVEGTVLFPAGAPPDDEVEVIADGKDIPGLGDHSAKVDANGRFRVAFSKESRTGALKLRSRFLHLPEPRTIKVKSPPKDLLLEPLLGGCIAGRIIPPKGVGAQDIAAATSKAKVVVSANTSLGVPLTSSASVDKDLRFELGGLAAATAYQLAFEPEGWIEFEQEAVKVRPGEVLTLDIECELGARLVGRVLDASGAGVGNAALQVHSTRDDNRSRWNSVRNVASEKDGSFKLTGVPPGEYELTVTRRGFRDHKTQLGKLEHGDVREALDITLDEGHSVSGVVRWPDGQAASGAYVRVEAATDQTSRGFDFDMSNTHRIGADGKFRIGGLEAGAVHVFATAKDGLRPDLDGGDASGKPSATKGARWRAQALNIEPGAVLELVLQPGLGLAGRVVDDRGEPLETFWVSAMEVREDRAGMPLGFEDAVSTKFDAEDGAFVLEGLKPGRWKIGARAKGHMSRSAPDTDIPASAQPLVIELQRTCAIHGTVVGPDGAPAAKAEVRIQLDSYDMFTITDLNRSTEADAKGVFKLQNAPSGRVKLSATHAQFADSAPLELHLAPGSKSEGVRLVLTNGGRLRGRIHERLLAGDATWNVWASAEGGGSGRSADVDAQGEFELEHLTPGKYSVTATREGDSSEDDAAQVAQRRRFSETVEVRDGATSEVLLGAPSGESFVARGRVTLAGQPLENASIEARRESFNVSARSTADGSFALALEGAGEYRFTATMPGGGAFLRSNATAGAEGEVFVEFAFPGGRIAGRVVDRSGEGLARVRVKAEREGGESAGGGGTLTTSATGAFEFKGLAAGQYRVIAEDRTDWLRSKARFGRTVAQVELAADAAEASVEIVVEPAASITAIVLDLGGQPASTAQVRALRADTPGDAAAVVNSFTVGGGRAELSGLTKGDWIVTAVRGDDVGVSATRVRVQDGGAEEVQVQLRRGARLSLQVQSASGEPLSAGMHVVDRDGVDWTRAGAKWSFEEGGQRWTLAPLPPGPYEVSAERSDHGRASASVRLSSDELESVVLRLEKD